MNILDPLLSAQQLADYLDVPLATIYSGRYPREGSPGLAAERWLVINPHFELWTVVGCGSRLRADVFSIYLRQLSHLDRVMIEDWGADLQTSGLGSPAERSRRTASRRTEDERRNRWTSCS